MATKHDRALASFLVGLDDVVEELSVVSDPRRSGELAEQLMAMGAKVARPPDTDWPPQTAETFRCAAGISPTIGACHTLLRRPQRDRDLARQA
jgi:hypothetical protein